MKVASVLLALALCCSATTAAGGLDGFLGEINVTAHADLPGFKADLSATFGLPVPKIDDLLRSLPSPADVYMTLRVGEVSHQPLPRVVEEFQRHKGQGWGVIAKNLGIKPGSREFHALKAGKLHSAPNKAAPSKHKQKSHARSKGKKS